MVYIKRPSRAISMTKMVMKKKFHSKAKLSGWHDYDLNGKEWMPIGASEDGSSGTFSGTFQGDDHIIYNLKITEGTDYQGLFGAVDSSGSLEGIHLRNASITADGHTGILAGKTAGDVKNCSSSGTITANGDQAGGLIGQASGTITNSCFYGFGEGKQRYQRLNRTSRSRD